MVLEMVCAYLITLLVKLYQDGTVYVPFLFLLFYFNSRFIGTSLPSNLIFFSFVFLGPYSQLKEVPRLGVQLELQLPAYTTAIAMQDPSRTCDLHHSSWQCWTLTELGQGLNPSPHGH